MSEFHSVINEFSNLLRDYDFKRPKKLWYNHLVTLSKHIEGDFYCYVIARVYKHDGSLETTLWVGPINRPDDGLEKLSANIKIQIGYNQTLDEGFFKDCESKIINLIKEGCLNSLLAASKKELVKPSVKNRRYEVYTEYILPFYHMVIENAKYDNEILKDKKKCHLIIEKTLSVADDEMKSFFEKLRVKGTIEKVWELCYLFALS